MAKVQRNWDDVAADLNAALAACGLRPGMLGNLAGIDYYAARRFLRGGVSNKTESAEKLCDFFQIPRDKSQKVQNSLYTSLLSTLEHAWDGSESHAELLTKLIRSTTTFKVEPRKS